MKILYVEDNAVNLSLIQRIAKMNNHDLVSFEEAEQALAWLEKPENNVDLILLDIQLAGEMDGIGFAKTLRGRGETHPIIAITAYAMMGDKERILAAGCNEYLPKPLPIAEFLTLLAKYDPALQTANLENTSAVVAPSQPETKPDAVTIAIETAKDSSSTQPKPPAELKAYLENYPKTEPRPAVEVNPVTEPKPTEMKMDNGAKSDSSPQPVPQPVTVPVPVAQAETKTEDNKP